MRKKATKKAISMALAAAMALTQVQVFAASSDIKGHWAESAITSWQDKGLITGYEDGTFKPDKSVTRAEFASMVNKALGLTEKGTVPFTDVQSGSWYYDAISIAVKAGYCSGYEDGTFKPNATITRAEAAVMISLAKGLVKDDIAATKFADYANIPAWAKGYVGAVVGAGYMSGRPDGTFDGTNTITRAEAVSSLNRAMTTVPEKEEETESKDVTVTEDDTVIDGQTIEGNLIIDKAVGDGEVYVKNTTVKGDIIVQGGGDDSIYLQNVTANGKVVVEKEDVRVQFEGTTEVTDVEVKAVCQLTEKDFEGTVDTITVSEDLGTNKTVKVNVTAKEVTLEGKASVAVNADVETLTIGADAKDSKVEVASGATIGTVVADGKVAISGSGKVEKLEANVSGITVSGSTNVTNTTVAAGVDKPTAPSTSTGGGGGGSSSSGGSSSGGSSSDDKEDVEVEVAAGSNLQTILDGKKDVDGLTLKLGAGNYFIPANENLIYSGSGKLNIEMDSGATFTRLDENPDGIIDLTTKNLFINANNAENIYIKSNTSGLTSLNINAPNAEVIVDANELLFLIMEYAKSIDVVNGINTTLALRSETTFTGKTKKLYIGSSVVPEQQKINEVVINGEVETVEVGMEFVKISGTGTIETVYAKNGTDVATEHVNLIDIGGGVDDVSLTISTDVKMVNLDGTLNKIEVIFNNANIDYMKVNSKTITLSGTGSVNTAVNTVVSSEIDGTYLNLTINDYVKVDRVIYGNKDIDEKISIDGNAVSKPSAKRVTGISVGGSYKNEYLIGEEIDLTGAKVTFTYTDGSEEIDFNNAIFEVGEFDSTESGEKTVKISIKSIIPQISCNIIMNVKDETAEVTATEIIATAEAAGNYTYDDYTYTGKFTSEKTENTVTISSNYETGEAALTNAMNDMARYLGALHYVDNSKVESIEFNGETYTWASNPTLAGSNWVKDANSAVEDGNTLVSAIVDYYQKNQTEPITLILKGGNASVTLKFTVAVGIPEDPTEAIIKTIDELKEALASNTIKSITVTGDITATSNDTITVKDGQTLTVANSGSLDVYDATLSGEGKVVVANDGTLKINANYNGGTGSKLPTVKTIEVQQGGTLKSMTTGQIPSEATFVGTTDEARIKATNATVTFGFENVSTANLPTMVIDGNVTIPEGKTWYTMYDSAPDNIGVTTTLKNGTMTVLGTLKVASASDTRSSLTVEEGATLAITGKVVVNAAVSGAGSVTGVDDAVIEMGTGNGQDDVGFNVGGVILELAKTYTYADGKWSDGTQTPVDISVTVDTTFPEEVLSAYQQAGMPLNHKTAAGLGLTAIVDGTTITVSGETTTT